MSAGRLRHISSRLAVGMSIALVAALFPLVPQVAGAFTNTATSTAGINPDAYTCDQAGYINFEGLPNSFNLSAANTGGVKFSTTGGYTWLVQRWSAGGFNGKYPSGSYTSGGDDWAWLGASQSSGRIDMTNGDVSYVSILASASTPIYLDAYNASGTLIATAGPTTSNVNTGTMDLLKITRATADIRYVVVHDSGNYFLVDSLCVNTSVAAGYSQSPAEKYGDVPSNGNASDPVSTAYGNYHDSLVDLPARGAVKGLDISRSYNSMDTTGYDGLSAGWRGAYTQTATLSGGNVTLIAEDGRNIIYRPNGAGGWVQPLEFAGVLSTVSGNYRVTFPDGTLWNFDANGRLSSMSYWDGPSVTVTRNGSGQPTLATSSLGPTVSFSYTAGALTGISTSDGRSVSYGYTGGFLTSFTDAAGKTTTYGVDSLGRVLTITDPSAVVLITNTYDTTGRVQSQTTMDSSSSFAYDFSTHDTTVVTSPTAAQGYVGTAPAPETIVYHHDAAGRLIGMTDQSGYSVSRTYDSSGWMNSGTDRVGTSTVSAFDALGNPTSITDPQSGTSTRTYDTSSRLLTSTSPVSGTTTYTYTGTNRIPTTETDQLSHVRTNVVTAGLLMSTTDADGVVTSFTYNSLRQLATATDGMGRVTTYGYDSAGRPNSVTAPVGRTTSIVYDGVGRVTQTTAPDTGVTTSTYDNAGRLLNTTDPTAAVTTNTYWPNGLLKTVAKPGKPASTYNYDGYGQLRSIVEPSGGGTKTYTYGILGRLTSVTDETNRTVSYGYDNDGRQTTATTADAGVTTTHYNAAGQVSSVENPIHNSSSIAYKTNGQVNTTTAGDGGVTNYTYDALGRTSAVTDPSGVVSTTTYTNAGRVHSVQSGGPAITYGYDAAGMLSTTTDALGNVTHTNYNTSGDVSSVVSPLGVSTAYTYDAMGRVLTTTDGAGVITTNTWSKRGELLTSQVTGRGQKIYTYNGDGTLATAKDPRGYLTSYGYDNFGRMTSQTNAAGGVESWGYDAAGRVTSHTRPAVSGKPADTTSFTYDSVGRVATSTDATGRVVTNSYDVAGQLKTVTAALGGSTDTYTYDYDAAGRLSTANGPAGSEAWTYDPAGRPVDHFEPGDRITTRMYDDHGRLQYIVNPDYSGWRYFYDSDGRMQQLAPLWRVADSFQAPDESPPDASKWTYSTGSNQPHIQFGGLRMYSNSTSTSEWIKNKFATADRFFTFSYKATSVTAANKATIKVKLRLKASGDRYELDIPTDSTTATVTKTVSGTTTALGTFTLPPLVADGWRDVAITNDGTKLEITVWDEALSQPATPSIQLTNASITGVGDETIGVDRNTGSNTIWFEDFWEMTPADLLTYGPPPIATETYNNDSQITNEALPNSSSRHWTYTNGRPTNYTQVLNGTTTNTNIGYDTSGAVNTIGAKSYTYDTAGELLTGDGNTYTYDNLGRRTTKVTGTVTATYGYDARSELTSITPSTGTATSLSYDNSGRRTGETTGSNSITYGYDKRGDLNAFTRVTGGVTNTQNRVIDSAGNVVGLANNQGGTAGYTGIDWDSGPAPHKVLGWQVDGATTTIGYTPTGATFATTGATSTTLAQDPLGSTVSNGAPSTDVAATSGTYDAFGVPSSWSLTLNPKLGFRGELTLDTLTDLRARSYQASSGTFTTPDPVADVPATPVVGDPYNYSSNDPLNRADPLGLKDGKGRSGDDGFTAFLATLEIGSLGDLANAAGDILHGIFDGAWDMIAGAGTLLRLSDCMSGPLGFLDNALSDFCENSINALHGMAKAAVKNPLGFLKTLGKGIVDWDECAKEGGYWCVGHFVPMIVICVLTDCASSAIDAVQGGYDALKALLATSGEFDAEAAITAAKATEAGEQLALGSGRLTNGNFAPGELESHFAKHAGEWGAIGEDAYLARARSILSSDVGGDIRGAVRANGDVLRYNVRTNEFAVGASDGTIRTLFRPADGLDYWLSQVPK